MEFNENNWINENFQMLLEIDYTVYDVFMPDVRHIIFLTIILYFNIFSCWLTPDNCVIYIRNVYLLWMNTKNLRSAICREYKIEEVQTKVIN